MKLLYRLVLMADLHCGSVLGITDPKYFRDEYIGFQKPFYEWFCQMATKYPAQVLICNGDAIEGKGEKSGGLELIETDRNKQVDMAEFLIRKFQPKYVHFIRGTPYHVGRNENWEDVLANRFGVKAYDEEFIENVFGDEILTMHCKHHIGSSKIPYGKQTSIGRDSIWNFLKAFAGIQPLAQWTIRSHVHYCVENMVVWGNKEYRCLITPCLQLPGTKYGIQRCSGTVDVGIVVFEFFDNGTYLWHVEYFPIQQIEKTAVRSTAESHLITI